jgi:hypothetical protein
MGVTLICKVQNGQWKDGNAKRRTVLLSKDLIPTLLIHFHLHPRPYHMPTPAAKEAGKYAVN